jgi:polyphosphate kinase 2 (PPK2 family)
MKRKAYEEELAKLEVELVKLQEWVKVTGAKICAVFEGSDTAGKVCVVALSTPTEPQKSHCLAKTIKEGMNIYGYR